MDGDDKNGEYGGMWHPLYAYSRLADLGLEKTSLFCLYHSRTLIKTLRLDVNMISRLGVADKLAVVYTPLWMYCREELDEYIFNEDIDICLRPNQWKKIVNDKCLKFVEEWKDKAYAIQQY